jgi:hypothetical protein
MATKQSMVKKPAVGPRKGGNLDHLVEPPKPKKRKTIINPHTK